MDCAKNAWWQEQSRLFLAKLLGPPKLHSMEAQAVGILLSNTWLPGSVAFTEDETQLAVYFEKARWLTASTETVTSHVWRLLMILFLMEDGRGTVRTGLHIPEQSCVNNWFWKGVVLGLILFFSFSFVLIVCYVLYVQLLTYNIEIHACLHLNCWLHVFAHLYPKSSSQTYNVTSLFTLETFMQ